MIQKSGKTITKADNTGHHYKIDVDKYYKAINKEVN